MYHNRQIPYCLPIHPKALVTKQASQSNSQNQSIQNHIAKPYMTMEEIDQKLLQDDRIKYYNTIEIWLDYLEGNLHQAINSICSHTNIITKDIIFTLRRLNLSEPTKSLEQRLDIINSIASVNSIASIASNLSDTDNIELPTRKIFIDLDISTQMEELSHLKNDFKRTSLIKQSEQSNYVNLITSFHNFQSTGTTDELLSLIEDMTTFDPCIFKIATYCNSPLDAIRLLELGEVIRARGKKSIILGMGPNGLATRIFGTLWGNELCYAPLENAEASAPGQISLEEFEKIFMIIKNQHT